MEQISTLNWVYIHYGLILSITCAEGAVNLDHLSEAADRAMYLAKRGGRNRVASVEHKPVLMTATIKA
jgi:PleD family two-component response regulator